MKTKLPISTISRLCMVFRLCEEFEEQGKERVSSTGIGKALDVPAHTIRKDFNQLGELGHTGSGYLVGQLKEQLAKALGFQQARKACIVGLGRLGSAILEYERLESSGYCLVAGFDASINRLETLSTKVPLYPAYDIAEVVEREGIELAIIAVPRDAAQDVADTLVAGGIKGIMNFAPIVIKPAKSEVAVRNMNVVNEMRILSSVVTLQNPSQDGGGNSTQTR